MKKHFADTTPYRFRPLIYMVPGRSRRELYGEPYLVSHDEVGHRLSISRTTVWRLVKAGELDAVQIGSRTFVTKASIDQFIDRHITRGRE